MPRSPFLDLLQILLGIGIGVFVIFLPGYAAAWFLNLFAYRERSWLGRMCLAAPVGMALLPILIYLPYRFISASAMLVLVVAAALLGLATLLRTSRDATWPPLALSAFLIFGTFVLMFTLVDLNIDGRVYNSALVWDHGVRVQLVSALAHADRLPIATYSFYPGHDVSLRYYYFAYFFPSIFQRLSFGLLAANTAFYSFVIWAFFALVATVACFVYLFLGLRTQRAVLIAWLLLGVSGLQLIPVGMTVIERARNGVSDVLPYVSVSFWNNVSQVTSWLDSVLWVPNHICALVALLVGCLLLWDAHTRSGRERWIAVVCAGIAFASGVGLSVYVCAIFAAFLVLLTVVLLVKNRSQAWMLMTAGVVALILALPFLSELLRSAHDVSVFSFWVRRFEPVTATMFEMNIQSNLVRQLLYFIALPVNYLTEMGLFFVIAFWWFGDSLRKRSFTVQERLMFAMAGVAFLLCTFVRSHPTNDFGWRGLLPGQFVLLLVAVSFFDKQPEKVDRGPRRRRQIALLLVALGILTSASEVLILRMYEPLMDAGLATRNFMLSPTEEAGKQNAHLQVAYDWIRRNTEANAVVQQNPIVWEEIPLALYSERRTAIFGTGYMILPTQQEFAEFREVRTNISELFQPGVDEAKANSLCRKLKLDYLVVQDADPVWDDRSSFVWSKQPEFSTPLVRVFRFENR